MVLYTNLLFTIIVLPSTYHTYFGATAAATAIAFPTYMLLSPTIYFF